MALINMTNKNGLTLKTAGKYCAEDITVIPTFDTGGGGSLSFNIHYGLTPPEDTSKLWVETELAPVDTKIVTNFTSTHSLDEYVGVLPSAEYNMAEAAVGDKIYLFGGRNSSQILDTIHIFDTNNDSLKTIDVTLPSARDGMACSVVGTNIYLFGGNLGDSLTSSILMFNTELKTIEEVGVLPRSLYNITAATIGHKIYLFGGSYDTGSEDEVNTIYVFDTTTLNCSKLDITMPNKRSKLGVGVVGNNIYLFGGFYYGIQRLYGYDDIYVFNADTLSIQLLEVTLPYEAYGLAYGTLGTRIYLFGGNTGYTAYTNLSQISFFDTKTNTVEMLDVTLPNGAYDMSAAVVGTNIYLFGGTTRSSGSFSSIHRFVCTATLPYAHVYIVPSLTKNEVSIIAQSQAIQLGIDSVYIGNDNDVAERANAYLYNGTEWQPI